MNFRRAEMQVIAQSRHVKFAAKLQNLFDMAKKIVNISRNCPNWVANENDYMLLFCEVDGLWRECSHNIEKFSDMLLSDYLSYMNIVINDYTQFMRILAPDYHLEYRANGARVRIDYTKREDI